MKIMNYLDKNHVVRKIDIAIYVPEGSGTAVHKNRQSHGIAFIESGNKEFVFSDGTVCDVCKNDILYLPKHSDYEIITKAPGNTYCINYHQDDDDEICLPFYLSIPNCDELLKSFQNAENTWRRVKDGREYRVMSELYKILYEIKRAKSAPYLPKSKQNMLAPAIDYIHKHYTDELINVKYLSELCEMSYDYFRRIFESFYGCSPIKYINDLKLKRAKELLISGMYSVSEAALQSGFSDISHFSRFFKKNVGVLPSQYK